MSENNDFRGEDLAVLFKSHEVIKIKNCPVCTSSEYSLWSDCGFTQAHKCNNCSLVFMSPQLSDEGLSDYYSNYIGKRRINNLEKMKLRSDQYILDASVLRRFISSGKLLDVGCNGGFFLSELGVDFDRFGTELDPSAVDFAKQNYPEFGENIYEGDIEQPTFEKESFDVITMRGVIEHVSDPNKTLINVSKLLKKGGYFYICATPNGESFSADLYREKWTLFHPVQHLWHFSPNNLETLCNEYDLNLVWKDFQYLETPYADPKEDVQKVARKILDEEDKEISPPFFENMMSLIFQKN